MKTETKVININNGGGSGGKITASCGSTGCDLQPYILPFLGKDAKVVKFTQFPAIKKAA
jgi:hypothetical protein